MQSLPLNQNFTDDGTWTYDWQHGRQLISMTDGTVTWDFTYNADGLRTQRTDGTTTYNYVYNGSQLTAMTVGTNTLYFSYDAAGTPMSVNFNGTEYFYTSNIQGDVTGIVDAAGATIATYTYDAWGNRPNTSTFATYNPISVYNPLCYRGYVYDQETQLYYLQSRYYNPTLGRFINADGLIATGQGFTGNNMFVYCGNNSANYVDPSGKCYFNANGQWCHDNWEYIGGYVRKPDPRLLPYNSADEAAMAFANATYSSSAYIRHEYSADIYCIAINGKLTYNYTTPQAWQPHSARVGLSIPSGTVRIAYVHTHPNSNKFSGPDKQAAKDLVVNAYVVGPNLILQRYSLCNLEPMDLDPITPAALTDSQCASLVNEFQISWDAHIKEDCDFNCNSKTWPSW